MQKKTKYINDKLSKLTILNKFKKLDLNEVGMDFDGNILYPFVTWDKKSVYPKIENGFAFKLYMNVVYVEVFNNQTFNLEYDESANVNIKYYNSYISTFPAKKRYET